MPSRIIAHIDLDAFFASVEERNKPFLKGLPLVIGADPKAGEGRGVVSTASYAARAYGVHSALPISRAWRLCEEARKAGKPACVFITPNHSTYVSVSEEIFNFIRAHHSIVEQVSVDEAYIDLSRLRSYKRARVAMHRIITDIQKRMGLTASVGIGPNKLIAKISSDFKKPQGMTVVTPAQVQTFLAPMSVRAIPGVGPQSEETLRRLGLITIGDVARAHWSLLAKALGSHGFDIAECAMGIDERVVGEIHERKSLGIEHTFDVDTHSEKELMRVMDHMVAHIHSELESHGYTGAQTLALKIRFEDFTTFTRSVTGSTPVYTRKEIQTKALKLILPFFSAESNPHHKAVRLIGLRAEKLLS